MSDMSKEEEELNKALKQLLPHHIKTEMQNVNLDTPIAELRRIYYVIVQFAKMKFPSMSARNEYHLRCQVISGISLTREICQRLIEVLKATDLKTADIPRMNHSRPHTEAPAAHMFRATYGIRMPYTGGGSVIFRVSPENSSCTKTTSLGSN